MLKKLAGRLRNENILSLLSYGVFACFEFAVLTLMAHTYSKRNFGEWIIFYSGFLLLDRLMFGFCSFPLVKYLSEALFPQEKKSLIGSSWILHIVIISLLSLFAWSALLFIPALKSQIGLRLLLKFFPMLALTRLPFNQGLAILQSEKRFGSILMLRLIGMGLFTIMLVVNTCVQLELWILAILYAFCLSINSILCILTGWSGIKEIRSISWNTLSKLVHYGKYSIGSFIAFNILRESDLFVIGFLLTKMDAAVYAIPLRLFDIINVPLVAFTAVAIPKISNASSRLDTNRVRTIYYRYTGLLTLLFVPLVLVLYFTAPFLISIFGGSQYTGNVLSETIFHLFLINGLFLSIDGMTGVTLDSINRPKLNLIKVSIMVLVNISGDILAITYFKSIVAVAIVTNLNLFIGLFIGIAFLKKELGIQVKEIPLQGFRFCLEIASRILQKLYPEK